MTMKPVRQFVLAAVFALLPFVVSAAEVRELRVETEGHGVVDDQSVLAFVSLKVGDEFSRAAVSRDIRSLQKSGRFASAAATVESIAGGIRVTYRVSPRLRIKRFEVEGADHLGNKKVRELMDIGVGDSADEATLAVRSQKVTEEYRKDYFPDMKLAWTIDPDPADSSAAFVKIKVDEGRRASVKKIVFTGNEHVASRDLLKVMKQRRVNWLSWITHAGTYDPDILQDDIESVRRVFLDKGYFDVGVGQPVIEPHGRKGLKVTIPVEERSPYRIGRVNLDGVSLFPQRDVEQGISIRPGEAASLAGIEKSVDGVRDFYGSRGYIRTAVKYDLDTDPETLTADLKLKVVEGRLARIRNINIMGNSQTKDKVIRRELAVYPGEIFNEVKVRTSERRLRNLNYFSYVNSVPEETGQPDMYDLTFDVEEQKTGQFMVGAGFSSVDNLIGFVELSQGNFDLFDPPAFAGGGQKLRLRAQFGTKRTDYEISFIEPWFLNRRLSLGVDLFDHESRYLSSEYDQKNIGGNVSLGKSISTYNRLNLIYGLEQIEVLNVESNASELIRQEEGSRSKSSLTLQMVHDSRDQPFVPTRGHRSVLSAGLAGGALGGDTELYTLEARSSRYWPLWFDHVFNLRGWIAVVEEYGDSDRVPIFDRLFLGGARTIRGFKFRDVGPKDETGEPIGGKSAAYLTGEYSIPVAEKVRLAGFYDTGMVWPDAYEFETSGFNSALGFGVRFDFPQFPIQLDYAWPIEADEFNDRSSGRFSFWLGYTY